MATVPISGKRGSRHRPTSLSDTECLRRERPAPPCFLCRRWTQNKTKPITANATRPNTTPKATPSFLSLDICFFGPSFGVSVAASVDVGLLLDSEVDKLAPDTDESVDVGCTLCVDDPTITLAGQVSDATCVIELDG